MKSKKNEIYNFIRERGQTTPVEISKALGISYPTVLKWIKILELEGKIRTKKIVGRFIEPIS